MINNIACVTYKTLITLIFSAKNKPLSPMGAIRLFRSVLLQIMTARGPQETGRILILLQLHINL
jgi:hypothetical protein